MMILSRIWYVILALLLAAAFYVVFLAVGQYNRRNHAAMEETLKADSQVVKWALDVDARRRLDVLLIASSDTNVIKAVKSANGKEQIPPAARDEAAKALRAFNEKYPDFRSDVLFATDREGRLVGQVGYDAVSGNNDFELGGYPAVNDALHGFLRDDTWVWGGKIARVVARPVEDEAGQPPIGSVVGLRWVDRTYAQEIGKRTRTNLAFFALGTRVSSAATTEGFEEQSLEALGSDLKAIADDEKFKKEGRTDLRSLGDDKGGVLFVRLNGDASELGAGFAVARPKVAISSPMGFIQGADDQDKKSVKLWMIALIAFGAALIGLAFSFLEHSMPMKELARQAERMKRGELDVLQVPRFRGGYRPIATDINAGIQRVVEKGGGQARKPADLESILGPVPAQPNMSAFSFPLPDGSAPPQQVPSFNASPPMGVPSAGGPPSPRFGTPAPSPGVPGGPGAARPPVSGPGGPGALPPRSGTNTGPLSPNDRTVAMGNAPPAPFGAPPPANPPPAAAQKLATAPAPFPAGVGPGKVAKEEDEATMVAQPSADLINAASGAPPADPAAEWQKVYEEFIRTKRECGEPTDGLTFEKFQQTLKKNRDALMQRHGCKRVKFSVYVKEGRASLKATPVRD